MRFAILAIALMNLASCSQKKPETSQKHYRLTGKILSVDAKARTATIDGAAIPNFMDAMKMEYPIAPSVEMGKLKDGEEIIATVNVSEDGSYNLSNIQDSSAQAAGK